MAKIFVWLRYSSSRQLTWQRNYNTQPRILGEAQARLTNAIAQVGYLMYLMHSKNKRHLLPTTCSRTSWTRPRPA